MQATAKIFKAGNSQALRLPKAFRLDTDEVWISKNEVTGDIIISPKPANSDLEAFFKLLESSPSSEEFIPARSVSVPRNPFEGWDEEIAAAKIKP